jgi:hypothetical protein
MEQTTAGSAGSINEAEAHALGPVAQATASAGSNYVSSRVSASAGNGQTAAASGSSQIFADGGNGVAQIDSTATAISAGSGASHAQVDMNFSGISTSRADLVFGSVAAATCCAPLAETQVGVTGKTGGAYAENFGAYHRPIRPDRCEAGSVLSSYLRHCRW